MNTHEEQILDAYLEELFGGPSPPDLSSRILQAWDARRAVADAGQAAEFFEPGLAAAEPPGGAPVAPPVSPLAAALEPEPPPIQDEPVFPRVPRRLKRSVRVGWWWYAAAASIMLAVLASSVAVFELYRSHVGGMVARVESPPDKPVEPAQPPESAVARDDRPARRTPARADQSRRPAVAPPAVARSRPGRTVAGQPAAPPKVVAPRTKPQPLLDKEVIAFVNQELKRVWEEHGVVPAPPATDEQWCRRVHARLIGREPTAKELERFARSKGADKRSQLVDELMGSEEYAQHWARFWTSALLGPVPRTGGLASHEELANYLAGALHADEPYDRIVSALLCAAGAGQATGADYRPEVYFLMAGAADGAAGATDRVSRVFLGRQLACARCHDHPAWRQSDYWELNAFFRQMRILRDPKTEAARLADVDFAGETGVTQDAEIFYARPGGGLRIAYPALDGHRLPHSGAVRDVNRRQELAKLVVAAPDFARAAVNRVWSALLGCGFTQPVDDMGPHNPPVFPELLERLADQFAAHDYQLTSLTRWVVLSAPFALSGKRMPESWIDAPENGGAPLFAWYYPAEERPRDIYKALVTAVQTRPAVSGVAPGALAARRVSLVPSARALPILETQPAASPAENTWLRRLGAAPRMRPEQKIEHVFLSLLSRRPTEREMVAAKLLLADRMDDTVGLRELRRTLLACNRATGR